MSHTVSVPKMKDHASDRGIRKPGFRTFEELGCDDECGAWPAPIVGLVLFLAVIMLGMLLASRPAEMLAAGYAGLLVEFAASSGWISRKDGGSRGARNDAVPGRGRRA